MTSLVPFEGRNGLSPALTARCDIAADSLKEITCASAFEYYKRHGDEFVRAIVDYEVVTESQIDRYASKINWENLGLNPGREWSEDFLSRWVEQFEWEYYGDTDQIPWSIELIERYRDRWDFVGLSCYYNIPWSSSLIEKYIEKWDWSFLSNNEGLPFTFDLIARYRYRWDYRLLIQNKSLPWDEKIINFFIENEEFTNFSVHASYASALPWSAELIASHADYWFWPALSGCRYLPWNEELFIQYLDRWDMNAVSGNPSLPWSNAFFERHIEKWHWHPERRDSALDTGYELPSNAATFHKGEVRLNWALTCSLSQNTSLPWTTDFISEYSDKWDFFSLSNNEGITFTKELIEAYEDRWCWSFNADLPKCGNGLSDKKLPWSVEFIQRYRSRINWYTVLISKRNLRCSSAMLKEVVSSLTSVELLALVAWERESGHGLNSSLVEKFERVSEGSNPFVYIAPFHLKDAIKYLMHNQIDWLLEFHFGVADEAIKQKVVRSYG